MADEQPQEQAKQQVKRFWQQFQPVEIALIVVVCGYFIYLDYSTSLITNINTGNETRVINGVSYPPKSILYQPNDYVPKSNVSNTQTVIGVGLVILLVVVLTSKRLAIQKRATIQEAVNDIASQLIKIRNIQGARIMPVKQGLKIDTDMETIEITYIFLTRYKYVNNERIAFKYPIEVRIYNKEDEVQELYRAYYHPWDRMWDGLVPAENPLTEIEQCPSCGKEYDEKVITGKDVQYAAAARRGIGEIK